MDWRHMPELMAAGRFRSLTRCSRVRLGKRETAAGHRSYLVRSNEMIFVFKEWAGECTETNCATREGSGRNPPTMCGGISGATRLTRSGGRVEDVLAMAPTVSLVALVADALLDCFLRGAMSCWIRSGVGSTLLAAERVGPWFVAAWEIEPEVCRHCYSPMAELQR